MGMASMWSRGRIEPVENKEITFRVIHRRKGSDPLQTVKWRESVHLVILNIVPGDVPAGAVGAHSDGQVKGSEVVANTG